VFFSEHIVLLHYVVMLTIMPQHTVFDEINAMPLSKSVLTICEL